MFWERFITHQQKHCNLQVSKRFRQLEELSGMLFSAQCTSPPCETRSRRDHTILILCFSIFTHGSTQQYWYSRPEQMMWGTHHHAVSTRMTSHVNNNPSTSLSRIQNGQAINIDLDLPKSWLSFHPRGDVPKAPFREEMVKSPYIQLDSQKENTFRSYIKSYLNAFNVHACIMCPAI